MRLIAVSCILSFCFIPPMHCAKRGPPLSPEKYKMILDPNDYYQSDEPQTDIPPIAEHDTEPSVHSIGPHMPDHPIQQYVNPYGGPYFPSNQWNPYGPPPQLEHAPFGQPPFDAPPQVGPFGPPAVVPPPFGAPPLGMPALGPAPFGPPPFGPPAIVPPPFGAPQFGPSPFGQGPFGFAPMQTEYGIFVPDGPQHHNHHGGQGHNDSSEMTEMLKDLVPRSIVFMLSKWSAFLVSVFSIVAFGGIVTTAICSLTPLCTISFASLPMAALRVAAKQDGTGSIDRVRRAVQFVSSAIEKFEKLQQTATPNKNENAKK